MRIKSAMVLCGALIAAQGAFAQLPDCASGALLKKYSNSGMVKSSPDGAIKLLLVADRHSADCGAPDCYGTAISISMKPVHKGSFMYHTAIIETKDYDNCHDTILGRSTAKKKEIFTMGLAPLNIIDPKLTEIKFMNKARTRAIILSPENFFYFEDIKPKGKLHTWLPGDDDDEQCCWGASMSSANFKEDAP